MNPIQHLALYDVNALVAGGNIRLTGLNAVREEDMPAVCALIAEAREQKAELLGSGICGNDGICSVLTRANPSDSDLHEVGAGGW